MVVLMNEDDAFENVHNDEVVPDCDEVVVGSEMEVRLKVVTTDDVLVSTVEAGRLLVSEDVCIVVEKKKFSVATAKDCPSSRTSF